MKYYFIRKMPHEGKGVLLNCYSIWAGLASIHSLAEDNIAGLERPTWYHRLHLC